MGISDIGDQIEVELLSSDPSLLGRLITLASLREANGNRYRNPGLPGRLVSGNADQALRAAHERVFADWLNSTLQQKTTDFDLYLSWQQLEEETVLRAWLRSKLLDELPPNSAGDADRQLFLCDIHLVLWLAAKQHGVEWKCEEALALASDNRVLQVMEWIGEKHGDIRLTLRSASERVRISERHFGRLFRKQTGMVFRAYPRTVRMGVATKRLLEATHTVQQVSMDLGYCDPGNFSNDFKSYFGISPSKFLQDHHNKR